MENMNLLDLNYDILNIIGDYVKADNNIRKFNELTKKEIFDYVDLKMKIKRKETRDEFYYVSRHYTRYLIWTCFTEFCSYSFNVIYLGDHDKYVKFYNEYLTLKN
jgi:hypothetical protein